MVGAGEDRFNCFREYDAELMERRRTDAPLVAVKDSIDVAGMVSMHGAALFRDAAPATEDATVVAALRRGGAQILGKTNMTEMACGTDGLNSHFGDVLNPLDPLRHAGGSSAGSAAAVAAGHVLLALGSDTGGSIRIPAAACGVVGLKPTFGRVSNHGMSVCSTHLDHIGPIAATVSDARWCLEAIEEPGWPSATRSGAGITAGVLQGAFMSKASADVVEAFTDALPVLERSGIAIIDVDLAIDLAATSEHATALNRDLFDRYGEMIDAAPPGVVGPELREWANLYIDITNADYEAARREQARLCSLVSAAMADVDILLCPTMREGVCLLSEVEAQSRSIRAENLEIFNMTGQPSLTVPWGRDRNDMPLGLLMTGRPGEDHLVLDLAERLVGRSLDAAR